MNYSTATAAAPDIAPKRSRQPRDFAAISLRDPSGLRMTEAEAVKRAQQGDVLAFEALYKMHKRRVYTLCWRMVHDETEAEDLAQEAFLQAYRKVNSFRGQSAFSTWLHRVTMNIVLMRFRKKGLLTVSLDECLAPETQNCPKGEFGMQDLTLSGSLDRINLERALESLPAGCRAVFVLFDIEGYEHNEVARMLGCSVGNSKSQLHKARIKLRGILQTGRGGPESARRKRAVAASAYRSVA